MRYKTDGHQTVKDVKGTKMIHCAALERSDPKCPAAVVKITDHRVMQMAPLADAREPSI